MLPDGAVVEQAISSDVGESPIGGEVYTWTAAWVVREAILVCPDDLTEAETRLYFDTLVTWIVSRIAFFCVDLCADPFAETAIKARRIALQATTETMAHSADSCSVACRSLLQHLQ